MGVIVELKFAVGAVRRRQRKQPQRIGKGRYDGNALVYDL
ncbi:hypothetical protein SDC9_154232 [bioreactor metagenome]|uniref:Uncharacterized protein n=1 Tax=bioreactor metagenome TaxID=1076179 RepID=A0A645EY56_9ZZZZ